MTSSRLGIFCFTFWKVRCHGRVLQVKTKTTSTTKSEKRNVKRLLNNSPRAYPKNSWSTFSIVETYSLKKNQIITTCAVFSKLWCKDKAMNTTASSTGFLRKKVSRMRFRHWWRKKSKNWTLWLQRAESTVQRLDRAKTSSLKKEKSPEGT